MTAIVAAARPHDRLRTLVLNADGRVMATWPPNIVPVRKAIQKIINDRVVAVETWEQLFRSPELTIEAPKVVMCRHYAPVYGAPKFCRRSVFLRDHFCCQYCGEPFETSELTFDHYVPRARGGRTVWENILTACIRCNTAKRDGNHMVPLSLPRQPTRAELLRAGLRFLAPDIHEDFGSHLYWETPLSQ